MDEFKLSFMNHFNELDKDTCVLLTLEALKNNRITIPVLYEEVLRPALYSIDTSMGMEDAIWIEHVKTSIIRTVVESAYPLVIELKKHVKPLGIKVILACPEREYHEVGLRMVADFFSLNGYEAIFIGTNTPREQVYYAIASNSPKYAAISVTDYYLLFEAQRMIQRIKEMTGGKVTVLVGGNAFRNNLFSVAKIGGDIYLESYQDIVNLRAGEEN
jgi:methanogenic corrinoid protein MtbC1